jgi:hypothetical protein
MPDVLEGTLDPRVAPAWVLRRHADHQAPNLRLDTGPSKAARGRGRLLRDQLAVPPKNGVGRHDRRTLCEQPTAEAVTDRGETPPFIIGQSHPPAVRLRFQHAVLFPQIYDHIALLSFQPAERRRYYQVQRNHTRSLR